MTRALEGRLTEVLSRIEKVLERLEERDSAEASVLPKDVAARAMGISLFELESMIRRGEICVGPSGIARSEVERVAQDARAATKRR